MNRERFAHLAILVGQLPVGCSELAQIGRNDSVDLAGYGIKLLLEHRKAPLETHGFLPQCRNRLCQLGLAYFDFADLGLCGSDCLLDIEIAFGFAMMFRRRTAEWAGAGAECAEKAARFLDTA
ncbi:hypothetical protein ACXIUS_16435 [Bosea thiooxidans]